MPYKLQNVRYLYYWTIITFTVNYSDSLNVLSVYTLLLYNISKTTTPFVNAAVNEALWQLVPFFHNGLFQLIDNTVVNFQLW